jgi:benzoyl-CoA reductase/2-hydroxyglutaryl-CoA dehydratase subunit BcrC/BadD/HgdB
MNALVGYTCAYTPLALIDAAGFTPYRILPLGDAPDRAGSLLHDNLCPHVKRILDRALANDVPELAGLVVMNSCDTMRRLADAWHVARPDTPVWLVDLPTTRDEHATAYFAAELERLVAVLEGWAGHPIPPGRIARSAWQMDALAEGLARVEASLHNGQRARFQALLNRSVTQPLAATLEELAHWEPSPDGNDGVPVYLFGNVLADPEMFALLETCGARVVGDDLCTGSRQMVPVGLDDAGPPLPQLARAILGRPLCARTLPDTDPDLLAEQVARGARERGARGVIAHVMKFCDPYLARMPAIRRHLEATGLPLLVLEGDCTTRSLGQHATRIEAFAEMLWESPP